MATERISWPACYFFLNSFRLSNYFSYWTAPRWPVKKVFFLYRFYFSILLSFMLTQTIKNKVKVLKIHIIESKAKWKRATIILHILSRRIKSRYVLFKPIEELLGEGPAGWADMPCGGWGSNRFWGLKSENKTSTALTPFLFCLLNFCCNFVCSPFLI